MLEMAQQAHFQPAINRKNQLCPLKRANSIEWPHSGLYPRVVHIIRIYIGSSILGLSRTVSYWV